MTGRRDRSAAKLAQRHKPEIAPRPTSGGRLASPVLRSPCADAVRITALVGTAGDEAAIGHEIVKPTFGGGSDNGFGKAQVTDKATDKQISFLARIAAERLTPTRSAAIVRRLVAVTHHAVARGLEADR